MPSLKNEPTTNAVIVSKRGLCAQVMHMQISVFTIEQRGTIRVMDNIDLFCNHGYQLQVNKAHNMFCARVINERPGSSGLKVLVRRGTTFYTAILELDRALAPHRRELVTVVNIERFFQEQESCLPLPID